MNDAFTLLTPDGKGIDSILDASGVLTFVVHAGPGALIRGTELFDRMMQYFAGRVRAIHGVWRKNMHGQPSTNVDKVNELTAGGMTVEDAIQHAWTVTRARRWGYSKLSIRGTPVGVPGDFMAIDVLMER